jgi:hypothetical protein
VRIRGALVGSILAMTPLVLAQTMDKSARH